jgi:hypothetical protein
VAELAAMAHVVAQVELVRRGHFIFVLGEF